MVTCEMRVRKGGIGRNTGMPMGRKGRMRDGGKSSRTWV